MLTSSYFNYSLAKTTEQNKFNFPSSKKKTTTIKQVIDLIIRDFSN